MKIKRIVIDTPEEINSEIKKIYSTLTKCKYDLFEVKAFCKQLGVKAYELIDFVNMYMGNEFKFIDITHKGIKSNTIYKYMYHTITDSTLSELVDNLYIHIINHHKKHNIHAGSYNYPAFWNDDIKQIIGIDIKLLMSLYDFNNDNRFQYSNSMGNWIKISSKSLQTELPKPDTNN